MAKITLKGNPINTSGELPSEGSQAPDFKLIGNDLAENTLSTFKGKKKLINIVPSLDTPVCAVSTKKFNETAQKRSDVAVLTISADLPFAQKRFCEAENTTSVKTLSMMNNPAFAKDYGMLIQDGPLAGVSGRAVVVLDENDKVVYKELVPEITQEPDYEKAIAALG
ncbi:MAG TPA: thiol peroxidase [Spirochaetes bacterium]|nr:thiol peroxidase [Spirochaetota bacterium]